MKIGRGFTLIEIMITLALMGTVFALVGPLIYQQVERSQASAEFIEARLFLQNSGRLAFLRGSAVRIELDGKLIRRTINGQHQQFDFNHLFFPKQQFSFNAHGFTAQQSVDVVTGRRTMNIVLDVSVRE